MTLKKQTDNSSKEFKTSREEFLSNCKSGKYDDVVAIYRSNASNKVGKELNRKALEM